MFYVYAIISLINNDLYIGYSDDLKRRIVEHNTGHVSSTKSNQPWKLLYYEAYDNKTLALKQEKRLKMHAAKGELKTRLGII
ncbi:MAG: GIY-YIG nuclease family protein [bacterium]|nr:GIY-YIG nuclease family protein [bacterium]